MILKGALLNRATEIFHELVYILCCERRWKNAGLFCSGDEPTGFLLVRYLVESV